MLDPSGVLISCSGWQQMTSAYNRVIRELPPDLKQRFVAVFRSYLVAYGMEGVYERFNGRTVAQILEEYGPPNVPPVLASGERDGVRYTLYDAPGHGEGVAFYEPAEVKPPLTDKSPE